jgi:hypothetical protein
MLCAGDSNLIPGCRRQTTPRIGSCALGVGARGLCFHEGAFMDTVTGVVVLLALLFVGLALLLDA